MQKLRSVIKNVKQKLPRIFNISQPVAQLFLGGDWETSFSMINFPSYYSPTTAVKYGFDIRLYSEHGRLVYSEKKEVAPFGSYSFNPSEKIETAQLGLGFVTSAIYPMDYFFAKDRHLGAIRPQIYAYYKNKLDGSIGIVHPQTAVLKNGNQKMGWISNQIIDVSLVSKLEVYQINPSPREYRARLSVMNFTDSQQQQHVDITIAPMGTSLSTFALSKFSGNVYLSATNLPGPNAKPIVLATRIDGSRFILHS